jgi:hypothetical protein
MSSYMFHTRVSSIISMLVHSLNLRLSADETVDFSQSGKCWLSEASQRRWLECILTHVNFCTPWCSLIVALLRIFGRHQLRLCMCYVNLSAFYNQMFNFVNLRQKRNMRIIHQIMHFPVFRCFYPRFLGSVGILPPLGGGLCADLHENTRVTCVWMLLTFLNAFCCFRLTLQVRGATARRQLRNETWRIAGKCSTRQC